MPKTCCLRPAIPRRTKFASGAAFPLQSLELLVNRDVIFVKGNFVVDLHFVKQPIGIALQNLRKMNADIAGRLSEAVHDSAQRCFVYAKHPCQAVLPDARGVHPQFQIGINVSIQGHGFALVLHRFAAFCGEQQRLLLRNREAIHLPNLEALICQHIVAIRRMDKSQKLSILPEVSKDMPKYMAASNGK
jgi:hypothetical protein